MGFTGEVDAFEKCGLLWGDSLDNNPSSVSILFIIWLRFLEPLYISGFLFDFDLGNLLLIMSLNFLSHMLMSLTARQSSCIAPPLGLPTRYFGRSSIQDVRIVT